MELTDSDLIGVLYKLVPGFFGAAVFHAITPFPKRDVMDRVVLALLFTVLGGVGANVLERICYLVGERVGSLGEWGSLADVGWASVSAVSFSFLLSWCLNLDWIHKWLRKANITKRTSFPNQWFSAFSALDRFVVLHLQCGRRLMGWPREWPDEHSSGHFWLEQVSWLMDDGAKIPLIETEGFLVKAEDVKSVEFLRFKDDKVVIDNAAAIGAARNQLVELHKEAVNVKRS